VEFYDAIFNINVKGLLFTVQKALPLLSDGASIVLNASIVASKGFSSNSVYSATKATVRSFARTFARTWTTDLRFHLAGSGHRMKSPRASCFSRRTTAATSLEPNWLWMAASHKRSPLNRRGRCYPIAREKRRSTSPEFTSLSNSAGCQ
jgi:NAD(P)-dependent dehydrogenase (short-subunit alcohol dehydrogenase family)